LTVPDTPRAEQPATSYDLRGANRRYRLLILGVCIAATATMSYLYAIRDPLYDSIFNGWGFIPFRFPFLDWDYVSAGISCWRRGVNVYASDPCDVFNRAHDYSPLWLRAWFLPTGPAWRNVFGLGIALSFFCSLFLVQHPRSWKEALVFGAASLSTMTVYALERGNVDAAIFAIIVLAIVGWMNPRSGYLSYAGIMFVGLLKFYPLVVLGVAIREKARTFWVIAVTSAVTLAGFYLYFHGELHQMIRNVPGGSYFSDSFGARNLPGGIAAMLASGQFAPNGRVFSGQPNYVLLEAILMICCFGGGYLISRSPSLISAYDRISELDRRILVVGALLVAGCFFAGPNLSYRGIHLIFVVVGLVALRRVLADGVARRALSALVVVTLLLMWDGAVQHLLDGHLRDGIFAAYWLVREALWYVLAAFLIGTLCIFAMSSPLLSQSPSATASA
jgi:hypothetical protein